MPKVRIPPPREYFDRRGKPHIPPSGTIIRHRPSAYTFNIRADGKLLLIEKRGDNGLLSPPGGGGEPGEPMTLVAVNETAEEIGVTIDIAEGTEPFCVYDSFYYLPKRRRYIHAIRHGYVVRQDEFVCDPAMLRKIKAGKHKETAAVRWVDPYNLRKQEVFFGFYRMFQAFFDDDVSERHPCKDGGWQ